jgi:hypothetical protein
VITVPIGPDDGATAAMESSATVKELTLLEETAAP